VAAARHVTTEVPGGRTQSRSLDAFVVKPLTPAAVSAEPVADAAPARSGARNATSASRSSSLPGLRRSASIVKVPKLRLENLEERIAQVMMQQKLEKLQAEAHRMGIQPVVETGAPEEVQAGLQAQLKLLTGLGPRKVSIAAATG